EQPARKARIIVAASVAANKDIERRFMGESFRFKGQSVPGAARGTNARIITDLHGESTSPCSFGNAAAHLFFTYTALQKGHGSPELRRMRHKAPECDASETGIITPLAPQPSL